MVALRAHFPNKTFVMLGRKSQNSASAQTHSQWDRLLTAVAGREVLGGSVVCSPRECKTQTEGTETDIEAFRIYRMNNLQWNYPLWPSHHWMSSLVPSAIARLLSERVKQQLNIEERHPEGGTVLVLLRRRNRRLRDMLTRQAKTIIDVLCEKGLPVEVAVFNETTPFEVQVSAFADAAVVISVHGAQLTNLAWMRRGSSVIEVLLRRGWCNDPWQFPPNPPCSPYHKADFANMARFFGLNYFYHDSVHVGARSTDEGGPGIMNPIAVKDVFVDSRRLSNLASEGLTLAQRPL